MNPPEQIDGAAASRPRQPPPGKTMSSRNADLELLARELHELRPLMERDDPPASPQDILVMRRVSGLPLKRWGEFCRRFPLSHWYALPLPEHMGKSLEAALADVRPDTRRDGLTPPPDHPDITDALASMLSREMLFQQLERELQRMERNGGQLTLICGALQTSRLDMAPGFCSERPPASRPASGDSTARQLGERLLCKMLRQRLDACDSVGRLEKDTLLAILPGYGLLRGRLLAERTRTAFHLRCKGLVLGKPGVIAPLTQTGCAFGIVTVTQSERPRANALLQRARQALANARDSQDHLYEDTGAPLIERATLVHSQEKRFLFFGGE